MSFQTDIAILLFSDIALNLAVTGEFNFNQLSPNFNLSLSHIVFNYRETEGINTLMEQGVVQRYDFYIKVISPVAETLLSISDLVKEYLTDYKDDHFRKFKFISDDHQDGIIDETEVFENTMQFDITYFK